jgi:hypothetical protein
MRILETTVCLLWISVIANSQELENPFEVVDSADGDRTEENILKWDDQIVEVTNTNPITFRGNDDIFLTVNSVQFAFSVDKKKYMASIEAETHNKGIVLISGDPKSPEIFCWMRPFMLTVDRAIFIVKVPRKDLDKIFFGFMPSDEKNRRYLYKASSVLKHFKSNKVSGQ